MPRQYRPGAIELLGENDAHELVRQRERGERNQFRGLVLHRVGQPVGAADGHSRMGAGAPPSRGPRPRAKAGWLPSRIHPESITESPCVVTDLPRSSSASSEAPAGRASMI